MWRDGLPGPAKTAALLMGASLLAAAGPGAAAARDMGFAVTWFMPAVYFGDGDCEDNETQKTMDFKAVLLKKGIKPAEIEKLMENTFSQAFSKALLERGANGENVCAFPESAPEPNPPNKTVIGKHAYGMNLDGSLDRATPAAGTCAHDQFEGPRTGLGAGVRGIDNQMYRVIGCQGGIRGARGTDGFSLSYQVERMRAEGMRTYLVELLGVDDLVNDDEVTVGIYVGADPLIQDARGEVQPDSTQRIAADPRWHNRIKGQIKDGVLTTGTFDFHLVFALMGVPTHDIKDARLQIEFTPDGNLKGLVGGYVDWKLIYYSMAKSGVQHEVATSGNCPGLYYAFKKNADGYPDPQTGQCTAISTAYAIEATPAFLVHPPNLEKISSAGPAARTVGSAE